MSQRRIGVLMSGHHNQSWLRCDFGKVSDADSHTNDLGFNRLVAQGGEGGLYPRAAVAKFDAANLRGRAP